LGKTDLPKLKKGMKVAVLAGSRGIMNISLIIKTVVDEIKKSRWGTFSIVAAMGSHGGRDSRRPTRSSLPTWALQKWKQWTAQCVCSR
jgi:hypothetical protein